MRHCVVDEQPTRESDDKNALAIVKKCTTIGGCVSQDSDALVSQGRKYQEKPDAESLGVRFTLSALRQGNGKTIVGKN